MKNFVVVAYILLTTKWLTLVETLSTECKYSHECKGMYRNCCSRKCVWRRFCNNYCSQIEDCAPNQFCVNNECSNTQSTRTRCDPERRVFCPPEFHCLSGECHEYCDCSDNEKCVEGRCIRKESDSLSAASIAVITAVAVVGSCVVCSILYCSCFRRTGRNPPRQQEQQQRSTQMTYTRNGTSLHTIPEVTEVTGGASTPPVHPGGPPAYHSLERIDRIEEQPPPSYEEAVRKTDSAMN